MKTNIKFLTIIALAAFSAPSAFAATKCSIANLTRCLDSACAINVNANPAARCQYCGTASAGEPQTGGMRSVSAGASAKFTLTAKQLKDAPGDPGERYAWATTQCLAKVAGCTADDVTEKYDPLIEQSCKAAGISAQMATLQKQAQKKVSKTSCKSTIQACIIADTRCNSDWRACEADADFNKFFSECGVDATGCDEYISEIRTALLSDRDSAIENADELLATIATDYQNARDRKLTAARDACKNGTAREQCIADVCANSMRNKCEPGTDTETSEKAMANLLCKFHDLACDVLE